MSDQDQGEGAAVAMLIAGGLVLLVAVGGGGLLFFRYARQKESYARMVAERQLTVAKLEQAGLAAQAASQAAQQASQPPPEVSDEASSDVEGPIKQALDAQVAAWNEGSIDKYMETYCRTEKLTFSSGGKTTRGWEATLARYKDRYRDKQTMGQLSFSGIETRSLSPAAALVLGRWQLKRGVEPVNGNFTLVMIVADGNWKIIHDHTSVVEDAEEEPREKPPGDEPPQAPVDP